jgi:hypothetical protein
LEPVEQVAGQVYYINEAISRGLSRVSAERKLVIAYEDFCQAPGRAYEQLLNKLNVSQPTLYTGPPKFEVARHSNIPNATAIRTAFESFTDAQT